MGSLNSRGIYIYDVNDNVAPIHELLNLGQSATSAALDEVKQEVIDELTPVSSRHNSFLSMASGWKNIGTSAQTTLRRKGDRINIRLLVERTGGTISVPNTTGNIVNQTIATVNTQWRPPFEQPLNSTASGSGRLAAFTITAAGNIRLNAVAGTRDITNGEAFGISGTYYLW